MLIVWNVLYNAVIDLDTLMKLWTVYVNMMVAETREPNRHQAMTAWNTSGIQGAYGPGQFLRALLWGISTGRLWVDSLHKGSVTRRRHVMASVTLSAIYVLNRVHIHRSPIPWLSSMHATLRLVNRWSLDHGINIMQYRIHTWKKACKLHFYFCLNR